MAPEQHDAERARLADAERHQRILSDVSRVLLDYVGPDETEPLRRIVSKVTEALGDWCTFSLVQEDGTLRQAAAWHPDPRQRDLADKLNRLQRPRRWDEGPEATNALLQKRPLVFEQVTDAMLRQAVESDAEYELFRELGLTSAIVAPLFDAARPLGSLILASAGPGGRRYSDADVDFVFSLAGRAALAVRNARLVRQIAEERDRQRAARLESERRAAELMAFLQADPNGIAMFGPDGRLRYTSPRFGELFAVQEQSLHGLHWREIFDLLVSRYPAPHGASVKARLEQLFDDPLARSEDEVELETPQRWIRRTSVPVTGPSGEYLGRLFVYVDVTEARELDRQRTEFLTVAAHELRTPLTPLSMYLQSIERRLLQGQQVDLDLAGKARRQVSRLTKLVEDLLDVTRLDARRMRLHQERVDLQDLADHIVTDFRGSTPHHEFVLRRPPHGLAVQGDRQRLEQVLVNLLQNAVKYSPHGGQIVVGLERVGNTAHLSVQDPGIGIPREEQKQLFQRFFRARNADTRNYSGLGIGLYVSNQFVEAHGGRFQVKSAPGRGSTFTVVLPLLEETALAASRGRVLLVDDDPEILEAAGQVLREWGYVVDEARDGSTALQLARTARPDLLLVDLIMPVMDGSQLIARMREERIAHGVPLVIFSADRDARDKARSLSADEALRKPFELEELHAVVERLISRKLPEA